MSRPTIKEIAALTARLRELSSAGRDADQADVDRFLADKRELLDRIPADDLPPPSSGYARSSLQAARELAAEGRPIAEAEAMVRTYLGDVSERVGVPARQWGLDDSDMEEMRAAEAMRTVDAVQQAHESLPGMRLPAESTATTGYAAEEPVAADEDGFG